MAAISFAAPFAQPRMPHTTPPAPDTARSPVLEPATAPRGSYRSKTLAAWLALLLGAWGLHRIYLHGAGDKWAWLHVPISAAGLLGVQRMRDMGQDDHLAWLLIPLLGLMLSQAMLCAIVYALTPDEKWHARHNPSAAPAAWPSSAWGAVFAAVVGLLVGGTVLMGTIAFSGQKFFEWQQLQEQQTNPAKR